MNTTLGRLPNQRFPRRKNILYADLKGLAHFGHLSGFVTLLRSHECPQLPQIHCLSGRLDRTSSRMLLRTGESFSFGEGATNFTISAWL
ncbi:MAG: hypothetical protein VX182_00325, partial [Candidatus Thermoplasmatota archaeon]|nr:hypothetical protein [Candidatus Thermoplasmatota archaeon]